MEEYPGEERIEIASYKENSVGKNFSASKVEYVFEFFINRKSNELKLVKSVVSGKLRIFLNQNLIHFEQKFEYNVGDVRMAIAQKGSKYDLTIVRKLPARPTATDAAGARGGVPTGYIPPYAIPVQTPSAIRPLASPPVPNGYVGVPLRVNTLSPQHQFEFAPLPVATPGAYPVPAQGTWTDYAQETTLVSDRTTVPGGALPLELSPNRPRPAVLSRSNSEEFFSERELFFYKTYF